MSSKPFMLLASFFGFSGVLLGAFAAHGLKSRLPADLLAVFQTGVQYQLWHALALAAVALWMRDGGNAWLRASGWGFAAGIVIFSGSLYVLALSGTRAWGAVTPVGGVAFLLGWLCLFLGTWNLNGSVLRQ